MNDRPIYSGRKVFLNLVSSLAGSGAGMVSLAVCMHLLGAEGVRIRGILAFSAAMVGFASLITETGFTNAHVKRVSEGQDLARCVGTYGAIRLFQSLVLAAIFAPVVLSPAVFRIVAGDSPHEGNAVERAVLGVTVLSVILTQIADIWRQTYAARREVVHQRLPVVIGNWLQVPAAIAVCGLLPVSGKTPLWWAMANLVTPVVALFYYLVWTGRLAWKRPTRESLTSYSRFAAPMTLSGAFLSIQLHLDKFFLRRWVGIEAVGLYELAQKVVQTFDRQILAQVGNLVLSKISQLNAAGRMTEIRDLVRTTERYLSFLAVPASATMVAAPGPILAALYGGAAAAAAPVFAILALVGLSASLNRPYAQAVAGTDRPREILKLGAAMSAIDLVLNLVFIPDRLLGLPMLGMGMSGAALSTLIAALFGTVLNRLMAARAWGGEAFLPAALRSLLAGALGAAAGAAAAGLAGRILPTAGIFGQACAAGTALAGALAAGATFLVSVWAVGGITRDDLIFFRDALNLSRAKAHVSEELRRP